MRISLGHVAGGSYAQQPLDLIQVNAALYEPCGKRMAQVMESKIVPAVPYAIMQLCNYDGS
jgi:hypothetical protein